MCNRATARILLACAVLCCPVLLGAWAVAADRIAGEAFATRSVVLAQHGMAATSHPLASQVALDVLKRGGTAMDAAIAANAVLGLMEPTGSGIGGDLFAIVWDPRTRKLHGLNASGRSAAGLSLDEIKQRLGERQHMPYWGGLSVTVPGTVDGWFALHERFGKLSMSEILRPAAEYARDGFPVTQMIAAYMSANLETFEEALNDIGEFDNARRLYYPEGRAPREGEIFRNPDLARTYDILAREGRDAFYEGELADVMDAYMRRIDGPLRKADFRAHSSTWVDPVSTNYRGYDVYELPPNGQGVTALQMLNMLEGFDLRSMGPLSADALHVMIEAKKLAFEDRARFFADPDFYDAPVAHLLSKEYATTRRRLINPDRAAVSLSPGNPVLDQSDTIYLTTADEQGMMVSLIQSNYWDMGSGLVPDGLGFMFQDRGALFTLEEGHPNAYAPGKRPFHTIIPAFVLKEGKPWLSFGVMGGSMQPQGHVQVLVNLIDFDMSLQEAGDAPRFNHTGSSQPTGEVMTDGGVVYVESGIPEVVRAELRRRSHKIEGDYEEFGGYQAILRDAVHGVYHGASESRKDGQAVGY